jgi:tetratricopeptide (TPR) repeat protein
MRRILSLLFLATWPLLAQSNPQTLRVVLPSTPGSISVGLSDGWKTESFYLYVDGMHGSSPIYRPVLLTFNEQTKLRASYILFANDTKAPTAEGCREADRGSIELAKKFAKENGGRITEIKESTYTTPSGRMVPVSSHFFEAKQPNSLHQFDMHAFIGDTNNCATLHLSKEQYQPSDEKLFGELIDRFIDSYQKDYAPKAADYTALANLLTERKQPRDAAVYVVRAVALGGDGLNSDLPGKATQPLAFAFATHPGHLELNLPTYAITELSAKPNGNEFGIRAKDRDTGMTELGFLYLPAEKAPLTAASCMQAQLKSELRAIEDQANYRKLSDKRVVKNPSGLEVGVIEYEPTKKMPRRFGYTARFFVAANDVCADLSFDSDNPIAPSIVDVLLAAIKFDANRMPDFFDKFRYATVLFDHRQVAAAAPVYESALTLVSTVDDATKWRRVATDQASMSYGMADDLKHSRALNEAAIQQDPTYPLYYYNLACADAESGDAAAARKHLQQAFDRRANTLKGETLPDPATDDSILKLKNDKEFWSFVELLGRN